MVRIVLLFAAFSLLGQGCGDSAKTKAQGSDGTVTEGGRSGSVAPVGAGGQVGSGGNIAGAASGGSLGTGGSGATGGSGPTQIGGTGGKHALADIDNLEMCWPTSYDAGAPVNFVQVKPDGTATCRQTRPDGGTTQGKLAVSDAQFRAILERPSILADLSTPCPIRLADVVEITTSFNSGKEKVVRQIGMSCSNNDLLALVAAIIRIGEGCLQLANATGM